MKFKKYLTFFCFSTMITYTKEASIKAKKKYTYVFDNIQLGDNYGKLLQLPPYDKACDNDPIDNRNRRFMVYGGLPCRHNSFPKRTTVMFYLKYSKKNKYNQPIKAFAYLYGSYFNDKTNFPLKPGDSLSKAKKKLGSPKRKFNISRKRSMLTIYEFKEYVYVICDTSKIIGFLFGKMPIEAKNEQWRGLMQMYQRYTPKQ